MVIDVHAHLVGPDLVGQAADLTDGVVASDESEAGISFRVGDAPLTDRLPPAMFDVPGRLRWMDAKGVDIQVVSTWSEIYGYMLKPDDAVTWCEVMNQALLTAAEDEPARLRPLAALPLQAPEAAADVVRSGRDRGFVGGVIGTNVGDVQLDDASLELVWTASAEAGFPLFIHPEACAADPRLRDFGLVNAVGRTYDTTIACSRLIMSGTLDRHPDLELLVAHGGGALPLLLGRLRRNHVIHSDSTVEPTEAFERLCFDTVVFSSEVLEFLCRVSSPDRLLCGSDCPFPLGDPDPTAVVRRSNLQSRDRNAVLHENAARLFRL